MYCDINVKISNFLNKFLHETLFPHPSIILIDLLPPEFMLEIASNTVVLYRQLRRLR